MYSPLVYYAQYNRQSSPVTALDGINLNVRAFPNVEKNFEYGKDGSLALGGFLYQEPGNTSSADFYTAWYSELLSTAAGKPTPYNGDPLSEAFYPIFSDFNGEKQVVAGMNFQFSWQTYFEGLLPDNARSFVVVLENECDGSFTYQIDGAEVKTLGVGDLHDTTFSNKNISTYLNDGLIIQDGSRTGVKLTQGGCPYSLHVYPSQDMYDEYNTNQPLIITMCILFVFLFTVLMFFFYDYLVERRQQLVVNTAAQSNSIVSSLFPEHMKKRLMHEKEEAQAQSANANKKGNLKSFLNNGTQGGVFPETRKKPLADLFLETTVMFADIAGFTSWSSVREPTQVCKCILRSSTSTQTFIRSANPLSCRLCLFEVTLLENVYQAFDRVAKKRRVFKVETVGDCYVGKSALV